MSLIRHFSSHILIHTLDMCTGKKQKIMSGNMDLGVHKANAGMQGHTDSHVAENPVKVMLESETNVTFIKLLSAMTTRRPVYAPDSTASSFAVEQSRLVH
jgi:hypothetical protein